MKDIKFTNKDKFVLLLVLIFFLISIQSVKAGGSIGSVQQNQCIQLLATCGNCSFMNLTSVTYPINKSFALIGNFGMTKTGGTFNYSFCNTNITGIYYYTVYGDGAIQTDDAYFEVTPNGTILSSSESIIYILLTGAVFFFFILSLYFTIITPYSNESNELGIIRTTKYKYVKLSFFLLSYVLFVWFLNSLVGLAYNFLKLTLFYGFVSFLFSLMIGFTWVLAIVIFVIMGAEIIRDININKEIEKFGSAW